MIPTLAVVAVAALAVVVLLALRRDELRTTLDHFRFYTIAFEGTYPAITTRFQVTGQLELGRDAITFSVRKLDYFGAPVVKNQENDDQFVDPNDHLSWYEFIQPTPEVDVWQVFVRNQYTGDQVVMFELDNLPKAVLVPTWKKKDNLRAPQRLSHFKLYRIVNGVRVDKPAALRDQFLDNQETVMTPLYFGVPVKKKVLDVPGTPEFPLLSKPHLTIYALSQTRVPDPRVPFKIKNQFEDDRSYKVVESVYLAVPTEKLRKRRLRVQPQD
jgi:hypothetical protein